MAKTIDDLYNKITELVDVVQKNAGIKNDLGANIDTVINNFKQQIGNLTNDISEYNTFFENDLIANQKKNAHEIEEICKKTTELYKEYIKNQTDIIQAQQKILEDTNATEEQKNKAREEIKRQNDIIVKKTAEFNEKSETKASIRQINQNKRAIQEDEEDKARFRQTKIGKSITKVEDIKGNARMYGKAMQSIGDKMGGKFGATISKTGGSLTKLGSAAGGAAGVLTALIVVAQIVDQVFAALANTSNELQRVENDKATIQTQRDIQLNTLEFEEGADTLKTEGEKIQKKIALTTKIGLEEAQIAITKANASIATGLNSITNGINESAWEALNKNIDIEASEKKLENTRKYETQKTENEIENINKGYEARQSERRIKKEQAEYEAIKQMTEAQVQEYNTAKEHYIMSSFSYDEKTKSGDLGKDYGEVEGLYDMGRNNARLTGWLGNPGLGNLTDKQLRQQADVEKRLAEMKNDIDSRAALTQNTNNVILTASQTFTDIKNSILDFHKDVDNAMVEAETERKKMYSHLAQTIENMSLELQKTLYESGNSKGLTSGEQLYQYNMSMQDTISNITKLTGLTNQEIISIQNSYGNNSGRTLLANKTDLTKAAYISKFTNDNNLPSELANSTEIFNIGMSDALENINKIAMQANKMGLDGRKYMKDISQNLKLAQKYTFKGGVRGLMNMAKWAQNIRFDMTQLPTIIDKLLDGGLQGAITQGSQLQVLGGQFAMGADPLAMLYEAIDDPEALAKRYAEMLEGMGTWNDKTGQVDFKGPSVLMLGQMAKITGLAVDNLRTIASQNIKKQKISPYINSDLTEEQKSTLINKAYRDEETGKWKVNTIDNKSIEVSKINKNNIKNVQSDTFEGVIEQSLSHIIGSLDLLTGATESSRVVLSRSITENGNLDREMGRRIGAWQDNFITKFDEYKKTIMANMRDATDAYAKNLMENAQSMEEITIAKLEEIKGSVNDFQTDYDKTMTKIFEHLGIGEKTLIESISEFITEDVPNAFAKTIEFGGDVIHGIGDFLKDPGGTIVKGLQFIADPHIPVSNFGKKLSKFKDVNSETMNDGVMSSNGSSMLTSASNITPINDGSVQLAQSDPQDVALFAKTGGPFDTLFNGIFAKINEISNVLPRSMEYIMPLERIFNEINHSKGTANNSKIQIDTVKIELNGKLELSNSNGQSIDIINEIKNNPILLRTLSQLISETMKKNIDGGKSTYTGGIATPRFN